MALWKYIVSVKSDTRGEFQTCFHDIFNISMKFVIHKPLNNGCWVKHWLFYLELAVPPASSREVGRWLLWRH